MSAVFKGALLGGASFQAIAHGPVLTAVVRGAYTPPPAPSFPDLAVSGAYNGTQGSGGAVPAESLVAYATGPTGGTGIQPELKAIGGILLPDDYTLEADRHVTVTFGTFADLWMDTVQVGWEGTTVTAVFGVNPDDDTVGWIVKLKVPNTNGWSMLWARGKPKNGLERVQAVRVYNWKDGTGRPTRYIDASRPDDSGDGLTPATAWKTIAKVTSGMTSAQRAGAKIIMAAGTYAFANFGAFPGDRDQDGPAIEFIGAGQALTEFNSMNVTSGSARWSSPRVVFRNLHLNLANVIQFYGPGALGITSTVWIDNCKLSDNWHSGNVRLGYPAADSYTGNALTTVSNNFFRAQDGTRWTVTNVTDLKLTYFVGVQKAWNVVGEASGDVRFLSISSATSEAKNYLWQKVRFTQNGNFESRVHLAQEATITAIDTVTTPGKTWVAFAGDTFHAAQMTASANAKYFRLITPFDGRTLTTADRGDVEHDYLPDGTRPFDTMGFLQDNNVTGWNPTNNQVRFNGDLSSKLFVGDTMRGYILNHGDAGQSTTNGGTVYDNFLFIDVEFYSHNWQPYLWRNPTALSGTGTATGTGTSITLSALPTGIKVHDYLVISNHWRRITAISGSTLTVSSAFPSDPSGAAASVFPSLLGWMEINSINDRAGTGAEFAQIEPAVFNCGFIYHLMPHGRGVDELCVGLRQNSSLSGGFEGLFFLDGIYNQLATGDAFAFPQANVVVQNSHFITLNGTSNRNAQNDDGTQPTGAVWPTGGRFAPWAAGHVPGGALTETVELVRWPYDLNRNARAVGSLVGPVLALAA
jgi:hypothetical protein